MKPWLTLAEIAALALPGLPETERGVRLLAEREAWDRRARLARPRAGRGGGFEYHVALLPLVARVALFAADAPPAPTIGAALQAAPEPPVRAPAAATRQLDARIAVIAAYRAFRASSGLGAVAAAAAFVDLYNLGGGDVPGWARAALPRLSARTLRRWLGAARAGETDRLAVDRGAARRGKGVLDAALGGEIKQFLLALHAFNTFYTGRQLRDAMACEFGARLAAAGQPVPSLRTLEARLARWKTDYAAGLLSMTDPDAFRSRMRTSGSYAHAAPWLNSLWQIDASPVDALCVDGRWSIYVCIDVWSRRLKLLASRTPRSVAVQLVLRKAILAWGVPDVVKSDNGSDFTALATARLFEKLRIEAIRATAFSPWQKGFVERAIRTFQTDCARMLPGFVGHDVAQRKRIEGRKAFAERLGRTDEAAFAVSLTGEELQAILDAWAEGIYERAAHGGLAGATPFARAASSTHPLRTVDPDALAVLLMQAPDAQGLRTVGKTGVRVAGWDYYCPDVMVGDRVFVRLDPDDMGVVWLFEPDGDRFLGRATCPDLSGEDRAALVAQTRAAQKQALDAQIADIRKITRRRITDRTVLEARLGRAGRDAARLLAFPARREAHSTPALDDAARVAGLRRGEAPEPAPMAEDVAAEHRRMIAAAQEEAIGASDAVVTPLRVEETPAMRFRRALAIEAALEAGADIATDDALWLGAYRASAEYAGRKAMFEDFGEAALR